MPTESNQAQKRTRASHTAQLKESGGCGESRVRGETLGKFQSRAHLVCRFRHGNRAADVCSPTAVHNAVVHDQVPDNTHGIVQSAFGLFNDLLREN